MLPERFATVVIGLSTLALPYCVFALGNRFERWWLTLSRAVVAIGVGWTMTLAYALAAGAIAFQNTSPDQLEKLYEHDGAPLAFAAVFGWVPSALIVAITALVHRVLVRKVVGQGSNKLMDRQGGQ